MSSTNLETAPEGDQVNLRNIGHYTDLARRAPDLQSHVYDGVLADGQSDPLTDHRLESLLLDKCNWYSPGGSTKNRKRPRSSVMSV